MTFTASTALIVCVFIGLCASLAECAIRPREMAQRISTALYKRQERTCSDESFLEIFQNFPNQCISAVVSLDECGHQCLSIKCNDTCAQPFYDFFVECFDDPTLISSFELLCSRNESGTLCYDTVSGLLEDEESKLEQLCEDATTMSCSVSCMEELQKSNSETGCCLYTVVALATSQQETDKIWAACDVDTPDLCTGRFTGEPIKAPESGAATGPGSGAATVPGSGAVTVTSYFSILMVTLLMASVALN